MAAVAAVPKQLWAGRRSLQRAIDRQITEGKACVMEIMCARELGVSA